MIDTDDIVERYSKVISKGFATMEKRTTGRWVEYSAYKSLQQRIAKLEFKVDFRGKYPNKAIAMTDTRELIEQAKTGKRMLFLTSFPSGQLREVEILGKHPSIKDGIYIRYLDTGGSDTTTDEFLFDDPSAETIEQQARKIERFEIALRTIAQPNDGASVREIARAALQEPKA